MASALSVHQVIHEAEGRDLQATREAGRMAGRLGAPLREDANARGVLGRTSTRTIRQ